MDARVDRAGRVWRQIDRGGTSREEVVTWVAKPIQRRKGTRPQKPRLHIGKILKWADQFHKRNGRWPNQSSGRIAESPWDNWNAVNACLREGNRGLPGRSSLAQLLTEYRGARTHISLPRYTIGNILSWADAHHEQTGSWPKRSSGPILAAPAESWGAVDKALIDGYRGLPGGSSLARMLAERRQARNVHHIPELTIRQVLDWADSHYRRTGRWPQIESGRVLDAPGETWNAVNHALSRGRRGLPGGTSLANLLDERRGVPNRLNAPRLSEQLILKWADAHRRRTGRWPRQSSGGIPESPRDNWRRIDMALRLASRGLVQRSSLAQLLARRRSVLNHLNRPKLHTRQILSWAYAHRARTGRWPSINSGVVHTNPAEKWSRIDSALRIGGRGLRAGGSLARLLRPHVRRPNEAFLDVVRRKLSRSATEMTVGRRRRAPTYAGPQMSGPERALTIDRILAWSDQHHARTGRWPNSNTGKVVRANGETWAAVDLALARGSRGLPGGMTLPRLLAKHRGVRNRRDLPHFRIADILKAADSHHNRTGCWPTWLSGAIPELPGETWQRVQGALDKGQRGLPGGSSLHQLLVEHRGIRNRANPPALTVKYILQLADAHHKRFGKWPRIHSAAVHGANGETWSGIDTALRQSTRGCSGYKGLADFLARHRAYSHNLNRPPLTEARIVAWADTFHARTGDWPMVMSGPIEGAPAESWNSVNNALQVGLRGLKGGDSLARLLARHRGAPLRGRYARQSLQSRYWSASPRPKHRATRR